MMFFSERSSPRISEDKVVRFLARAIPYLRFRRRRGIARTLKTLAEVTSTYADFVPHADKIKVESLDEFYTYDAAVSLIDPDFLEYLMLEVRGNRVSWQTICAWLVLLACRADLFRVFERSLSKSDTSEINKEAIDLVLDEGRGRSITANHGVYEHLDAVRAAMARAAPVTPKRRLVRTTSREGKKIIKAFKADIPAFKSLYEEKGAAEAAQWAKKRSWYWLYTKSDDVKDWIKDPAGPNNDCEWAWGYWL